MKHRSVKFGCVGLLCCLGMGLLAGCGSETVDYAVSGEAESVKAEDGIAKKGIQQFANAPEWHENWTTLNTKGSEVAIDIDAKIAIPDVEQMYVVEVEEPVFDETYKERVVKRLFGDKKYSWKLDEFSGEREGISYTLRFEESEPCLGAYYSAIHCRSKEIILMAQDISEVGPETFGAGEISYYGVYYSTTVLENECEISEDEALELAQNFVEEMDLGYSVYSYSRPLTWVRRTTFEQMITDGYIFYFDVGVDTLPFVRYGRQDAYINFEKKKETEEAQYYMWAQMEVFVTDKGVIEMRAHNPLVVTGISGGVDLLALDDVKEIIKNAIDKQFGIFRFRYGGIVICFNKMDLIYFRVRDKGHEGYYSYVPAWRISEGDYTEDESIADWQQWSNAVLINAIDGSVIDFYDEV